MLDDELIAARPEPVVELRSPTPLDHCAIGNDILENLAVLNDIGMAGIEGDPNRNDRKA